MMQVKSLDLSRLDPFCKLEDQTGEVGGSLHRDIMDHCGHMVQVSYRIRRGGGGGGQPPQGVQGPLRAHGVG